MSESDVLVVPANEASWDDLQAAFGRGAAARCQCQRIKLGDHDWFRMQAPRSAVWQPSTRACPEQSTTHCDAKSPGQAIGGAAGIRCFSAFNASRTAVSSWGSRPAAQSFFFIITPPPPTSTLFPYTPLFR